MIIDLKNSFRKINFHPPHPHVWHLCFYMFTKSQKLTIQALQMTTPP